MQYATIEVTVNVFRIDFHYFIKQCQSDVVFFKLSINDSSVEISQGVAFVKVVYAFVVFQRRNGVADIEIYGSSVKEDYRIVVV